MSFGAVICQNWNATKLAWPGSKKIATHKRLAPKLIGCIMDEEDEADFSVEHDDSERKESENFEEVSEDSASEERGKKTKAEEELRHKVKVEEAGKRSKAEGELQKKVKVEEGRKKNKDEKDERKQKTRCVLQEARCVLQEAPKSQREKTKKQRS